MLELTDGVYIPPGNDKCVTESVCYVGREPMRDHQAPEAALTPPVLYLRMQTLPIGFTLVTTLSAETVGSIGVLGTSVALALHLLIRDAVCDRGSENEHDEGRSRG